MLTCELPSLLTALKAAKRVVPTRCTIPVMGYARVSGDTLTVTDLDMALTLEIAPRDMVEPFLIPVHDTLKLLSGVTPGSLVEITRKNADLLTLRAGDLEADLDTLPDADFPQFPAFAAGHGAATFDGKTAEPLFAAAAGCMSSEETRYYLRGINLHSVAGCLALVATDGHRLAKIVTDKPFDGDPVIMPDYAVKLALALGIEDVALAFNDKYVRLITKGYTLVTRAVDGTFPDYTRVMPKNLAGASSVAVADLKAAASRLAKIAGKEAGTRLDFAAGTAMARYDEHKQVTIKVTFSAERGDGAAAIDFKTRYLSDMADLVWLFDDMAVFSTATDDPALITPDAQPDGATVEFVLMPMRVQE